MKAVLIKSIMLVAVVIGLVHYALYLKTGRLPWGSAGAPTLSLPVSLPKLDQVMPAAKPKVYKWVDENGVLNFSQEPPPGSVKGELIEVNETVNIIQSTPVTPTEPAAAQPTSTLSDAAWNDSEKTPVEKAQEAKALLEAREREMKKILENL